MEGTVTPCCCTIRGRLTRRALLTEVQTCALPIPCRLTEVHRQGRDQQSAEAPRQLHRGRREAILARRARGNQQWVRSRRSDRTFLEEDWQEDRKSVV